MDLLTRLLNERAKFRSPEDEAALLRGLRDLVSLRIQNVADYYFMETDKGNFGTSPRFPQRRPTMALVLHDIQDTAP